MELRQLEYFACIARTSSYRRAAADLGMNESTLSIQVKQLERELGVSLFQRTSRGVSLTESGSMLLERAQRILAEVAAARRELRETRLSVSGRLAFGSTSSAPDLFAMLAAFVRTHPEVDLEFSQRHSPLLVHALTLGELDVAFVLLHEPTQRLPSNICVERLLTRTFGLLVRADHCLAQRRSISIRELEAERLILQPAGSAPRAALDSALRAAHVTPNIVPFETTSPGSALDLVEQGLGVAIGHPILTTVGHRNLRAIRIDDAQVTCSGALLWARHGPRTPAIEVFRRFACAWDWAPSAGD